LLKLLSLMFPLKRINRVSTLLYSIKKAKHITKITRQKSFFYRFTQPYWSKKLFNLNAVRGAYNLRAEKALMSRVH